MHIRFMPRLPLETLPWDTNHFGFPVVRITRATLDDAALAKVLSEARARGTRLLYWPADHRREPSPDLMSEFSGRLVARQAAFETLFSRCTTREGQADFPVEVHEYAIGLPSQRLLELALIAGTCSRFHVDPGIPEAKFQGLYAAWITRSTLREIASMVLVARAAVGNQEILGMVTICQSSQTARIGLIAVVPQARCKGIGSALLTAARLWAAGKGVARLSVVTQQANTGACRLYIRNGYRLRRLENLYHFWPAAGKC
jgi:dTDP-4-amino-4,6-dideoxy-D-galactose acyltransferase